MATDKNFVIKNGLEVGGQLIVNSSGQLEVSTVVSDLHLQDNIKAKFGLGSDLQIQHTGSESQIFNSTGQLDIRSSTRILLSSSAGENMARFTNNGAAELFYDNAAKLATKSDGVDITGELQSDSLDVDGNADISGNLVLGGDLTVNGTTTTLNTSTLTVDDLNITVADGAANAAAADGAGITVAGALANMVYQYSNDRWTFNKEVFTQAGFMIGTTATDVGLMRNSSGVFDFQAQSGRQISFSNVTNGEHVRIDADGNVGIGTTSPAGNLHIKSIGDVGDALLIVEADADNNVESDNPRIELRQDNNLVSGALYLEGNAATTATNSLQNGLLLDAKGASNDGSTIQFATGGLAANQTGGPTNSAVRMTILRDGNVGIGTTSPTRNLTVHGGSGNSIFALQNDSTGSAAGDGFQIQLVGTDIYQYNYDNGFMAFGTSNAEKMRLDASGNLGIGQTSPNTKLHVAGDIRLQNSGKVYLWNDHNSNYIDYRNWIASSSAGLTINNTAESYIRFNTHNSERVRIDSDGNVGIGSTAPDGPLFVGTDTANKSYIGTYLEQQAPVLSRNEGNECLWVDRWGSVSTSGTITNSMNVFRPGDNFASFSSTTGTDNPIVYTIDATFSSTTDVSRRRIAIFTHGGISCDLTIEVKNSSGVYETAYDAAYSFSGGRWHLFGFSNVISYPSDWNIQGIRITIDNYGTGTKYLGQIGITNTKLSNTSPFLTKGGSTLYDDSILGFGNATDLEIYHSSSDNNSYIRNINGDLYIKNEANDKDIIFQSEDGSGGVTTYFTVDGSARDVVFNKDIKLNDNVQVQVGSSADLQILHDASDSFLINNTGDLYIRNNTDDKDIILQSDDGSGGLASYFSLDGSNARNRFHRNVLYGDGIRADFGDSSDLKIYHDGSNSYISESGTGSLIIKSGGTMVLRTPADENMIHMTANGAVKLYYDNAEKLTTKSDGVDITGNVTVNGAIVSEGGSFTSGQETVSDAGIIIQKNDWIYSDDNNYLRKIIGHTSSNHIEIGQNNTVYIGDIILRPGSSGNIRFFTSGSEDITFTSAGDVGIGTTTPNSLLHVSHATAPTFRLSRTGTGQVWVQSIDSSGRFQLAEAASEGGTQNIRLQVDDTGEITFNSAYTFPTADGSPNQVLQTDGSGNLSFATVASGTITSASNMADNRILTASGSTTINGESNLTFNGSLLTVTNNGGHTSGNISISQSSLDIYNPLEADTDEKGSILTFSDNYYDAGNTSYNRTIRAAIKGGTDTTGNTADGFLAFYTDASSANSATERMRITKDGNVGIGTTSPSVKLFVNDGIIGVSNSVHTTYYEHDKIHSYATSGFTIDGREGITLETTSADKDIVLRADDGSGGLTSYITVDGSATTTVFGRNTNHPDTIYASFGTGNDLQITHNNTDSFIHNYTGDLKLIQYANDGDISFQSDDGYGGNVEYMRLDGGITKTVFEKDSKHQDGIKALFGTNDDLRIQHTGSAGYVANYTGTLSIQNNTDDGDVVIQSDNGSGSVATYFMADGSSGSANLYHYGSLKLNTSSSGITVTGGATFSGNCTFSGSSNQMGGTMDFGSDVLFEGNATGGIFFDFSDDALEFSDNARAKFGSGGDVELYFDGTGTVLRNTAASTGNPIYIQGGGGTGANIYLQAINGTNGVRVETNGKVALYHGSTERLYTTSSGVTVTGLLSATTKSFDIPHPSKEDWRLRYGSLEGPENGVYVRGKSKEKVISLPEYWVDLVHEDSITVQLTAIGGGQNLYVEKIEDNKVYVNGENYFYYIQAERKDVEKLEVEYEV